MQKSELTLSSIWFPLFPNLSASYPTVPLVAPPPVLKQDPPPQPLTLLELSPPHPLPSLLVFPPTHPPHTPAILCCHKNPPSSLPSCRTCQDPCQAGPECTLRSTLIGPGSTGIMSLMWSNGGKYPIDPHTTFAACNTSTHLMFGCDFFFSSLPETKMTFSWCEN